MFRGLKAVGTGSVVFILLNFHLANASIQRFEAADAAFKERENQGRALAALIQFRNLHRIYPNDADAAWRVAMACYFIGLRSNRDADQKQKLFQEGQKAGEASLALTPHCAACHFWTAINMALYAQSVGSLKMLFTLSSIREHLEKSIAIDPTYAYGGAYRLLGLIAQKLPGILGGSNSDAKNYFEKAVATSPDEPLNYLFLAKLLKEELHASSEGLAVANTGAALPSPTQERLEAREAQAQLKTLVAEWKK